MTKAVWNEAVIAESRATVMIEGNHYFPPEAVDWSRLEPSATRTTCGWKGVAHYFHVVAGGERLGDGAWTYPHPEPAAENIRDHVAFWHGVEVVT